MKKILVPALLATTMLYGCGDSLEDTRFLVSQLPGLYEGADLPIQIVPVVPEGAPSNLAMLDVTHITSKGLISATASTGAADKLRMFGQLEGEFDPDFNLINASGTLDVWYEPDMVNNGDQYTPGPHATATVVSAELIVTRDGEGEVEMKELIFDLDFEALPGQDSDLDDAEFDAYDGDYRLLAEDYMIELYEQEATYERIHGSWEALFEFSSEVELLNPVIDEAGEFASVLVGPSDLMGYCAEDYSVAGFVDPYDLVNSRTPVSNTFLMSGEGECDVDNTATVSFEGIGWFSSEAGDTVGGYDELHFRAEYVFSKPGEDDISYTTRWDLGIAGTSASLFSSGDSWSAFDPPRDALSVPVWYTGEDVVGGFDVNVSFLSLGNPIQCNTDMDISPQVISCPPVAGDCEPVVIPFDYNGNNCEFEVILDAEPALVNDNDKGYAGIDEFGPCSIEASSVINGPDDVIEIAC